jgi:hypothetical protein
MLRLPIFEKVNLVPAVKGDRMSKMLGLLAAFSLAWPAAAAGQDSGPLEVGVEAPDFELEGASRSGVLPDPVRLSDFRGKTVVIAFFYRVRTPG